MIAAVISMSNKCIITLFRKNASLFLQDFLHFLNSFISAIFIDFCNQNLAKQLIESTKAL